jgi:DNA polymerase III subunit delta'
MRFAEVVGHPKPLEILRAALSGQRLHHAYLFLGPEGIGKRTVAMALARAIHCDESNGDSCGHCVNCARIDDANHPDVHVIGTLAGKKEITIQQMRELERKLRYRSFSGKRKIAIVEPAESLNPSAQNALLKTLEEPPENSLIILIAPNGGGLLPTLRSRCLRLSFTPLLRSEMAAFLKSSRGVDAEAAEFLAAMSMGSIGAAINLDQATLIEKRRVWSGKLSALKHGDYQSASAAAEAFAASRDDALEFLRWAESWYRDLLVHAVTQSPNDLINLDMLEQICREGAAVGTERALDAIARIGEAAGGIHRNLNRRMVLEKFLFGVVGGH